MRYLHTMVRVTDVDKSLDFYCKLLGMTELRRREDQAGRYTNIFLAANHDKGRGEAENAPLLELTYNWDPQEYGGGRNFGHLAFEVDDLEAFAKQAAAKGYPLSDGPTTSTSGSVFAFIDAPEGYEIELIQAPK